MSAAFFGLSLGVGLDLGHKVSCMTGEPGIINAHDSSLSTRERENQSISPNSKQLSCILE